VYQWGKMHVAPRIQERKNRGMRQREGSEDREKGRKVEEGNEKLELFE